MSWIISRIRKVNGGFIAEDDTVEPESVFRDFDSLVQWLAFRLGERGVGETWKPNESS